MDFEFLSKCLYQLCLICLIVISVNCIPDKNTPYCGLRKFNPPISNYKIAVPKRKLKGKIILTERIVGGVKADDGEYPWIVSLQTKTAGKFKHFCGGTIISDYYILTAAHCAEEFVGLEGNLRIKMGTNNLNKDGFVVGVAKIIVHPKWDKDIYINDIALYKTKYPIKYDLKGEKYSINAVCLPHPSAPIHRKAYVIGWGKVDKGIYPTDLQKVEVPLYSHSDCIKRYESLGSVTNMMFCYGGQGNKDSCMGDSGGPLIVAEQGKFIIIGVVSYGVPCAVEFYPTIYTNLTCYLDWIYDQIAIK